MSVSTRSTMSSIGKLLPGLIAAASAAACSAPAGPSLDPARGFVETPSGRRITVETGTSSSALEAIAPGLAVPTEPFVIAKFAGAITPAARRALRQAGYREVTHLPYDALLLERPRDAKSVALSGMVSLTGYRAEDRLARDLSPEAIALRIDLTEVPVMVHVMPGHDRATVRAVATARGGRVAGEGEAGAFGRLTAIFPVTAAASGARALSELPEVFLVERIHHVGWLNDRTAGTIQSGVQGRDVAQTPIWAHGIRGEGQIVGMADTGLDANSCYFNGETLPVINTYAEGTGYGTLTDPSHRKIVAYDFLYSCDQWPNATGCEDPADHTKWDTQGHGTHVAGNMVGDSDNNPENFAAQDGMAPAAKIVVQDAGFLANACSDGPGFGCPVMKLDPLFEQSRVQGASVHNNSWGDNEDVAPPLQCNYTARSQDVDRYMWEHKDFLIVYAAGNSGGGNVDFSVGSPSTNKDGLSIGSSRTSPTAASDDNLSRYSSRGWTSDGRIKPDLIVPGNNTAAGRDTTVDGTPNCNTNSGGGTSYAAPVAVAAAALVRQYYMDGFYPSGAKNMADALTPSAALLKATLINSATSMKGTDNAGMMISPIPSNEQGWGRVQLDQALVFTGAARKLHVDDYRKGFEVGGSTPVTYTFNGVEPTQPLKVTLVWTDFPATPDVPPVGATLDNPASWNAARLVNDLDLTVSGPAGTYLGNVFTDGASSSGGEADRRNNVEQVLLTAPASGAYTITVQPKDVQEGPQDFAIVVTGAWSNVGGTTPPPGRDAAPPEDGAAGAGGGTPTTPPPDDSSSGCSCELARRPPKSGGALLALATLPLAMLRGRRRVRGSCDARHR
jgi:hypothetical protein